MGKFKSKKTGVTSKSVMVSLLEYSASKRFNDEVQKVLQSGPVKVWTREEIANYGGVK